MSDSDDLAEVQLSAKEKKSVYNKAYVARKVAENPNYYKEMYQRNKVILVEVILIHS